jgi:hypothetical protein
VRFPPGGSTQKAAGFFPGGQSVNDINSYVRNDRKSQNMRGAVLRRRLLEQHKRGVVVWLSALSDDELDGYIANTAAELKRMPRSRTRSLLLAFTAEKNRRRR